MRNRSKTFASKLLWLFSGTVIVCWVISSVLLVSILGDYTRQVRDNQLKWLTLYTRTFVQDIRVGNTLAIRTKMNVLIQSESYLSATLRMEGEEITERAAHAAHISKMSWFEQRILSLFPTPRFEIPMRDAFQVKWGDFILTADPRVFYHGVSSTIATYVIAHLGLLLIFLGSLILALRRQILPLQQLTRSVSFFASSDRGSPEDLEKVLKNPMPGASEELVVLKSALEKAVGKLLQAQTRLNDQRVQTEMTKIALQVAHDIRSPLCVLKIMSQEISRAVSADQLFLVSGAIEQIQSIAEDLLSRYRKARVGEASGDPGETAISQLHAEAGGHTALPVTNSAPVPTPLLPQLVAKHVETAITAIRMEAFGTKEFTLSASYAPEARWAFVLLDPVRFKRSLSNLLKNAVEAVPSGGQIELKLAVKGTEVCISIDDNGPGIDESVKSALLEGGNVSTKEHGHGLGLQFAKEACEAVGGAFQISTSTSNGASVMLAFPLLNLPKGIVAGVRLSERETIVVVDDDTSMHGFWRERLKSVSGKFEGEIHCFSRPGELFRWMNSVGPEAREARFFIDWELGDPQFDGVKILEQLDLWNKAILVSAREELLQPLAEKYEAEGIRMLPKSLLSWVPIEVHLS